MRYHDCMQTDAAGTKKLAQPPHLGALAAALSLALGGSCCGTGRPQQTVHAARDGGGGGGAAAAVVPGCYQAGTTHATMECLGAGCRRRCRRHHASCLRRGAWCGHLSLAARCSLPTVQTVHSRDRTCSGRQSGVVPVQQSRVMRGRVVCVWQCARLTSRQGPEAGRPPRPLRLQRALQAGQGCLVGAAIAKGVIPMRAWACMPPCVSRWH
jgi:hypothetical protein